MSFAHATLSGYTYHGCRCEPCTRVHVEYESNRVRQIAYGRWKPLADAAPVREHVQFLRDFGLGWKLVAALADVSEITVVRMLYGVPAEGRPPSKRIKTRAAEKLLAVRPNLDVLPDTVTISSAGTQRRIQAMSVVGWSIPKQARLLGRKRAPYAAILTQPRVTAVTARTVRDLAERLWNTPPPEATPTQRMAATKARTTARRNNWLPLGAWDEDLIDLPPTYLKAELRRRAEEMDLEELARCYTAHRLHGELSPLIVAGSLEYSRRKTRRQQQRVAG